tara:strand:+ start:2702 stop:3460 length:759 start_codon:yes stop_codon:yes gene_type:complete
MKAKAQKEYDFWKDWKNKKEIELKGISVIKKARDLILHNIPRAEIISIYSKGSFPRREMNKWSDIDLITIIKNSKYLKKFKKLEKANKQSFGLPIHLESVSLFELKRGKKGKLGGQEGKTTSRIVKQLNNFKLIYGMALEGSKYPKRSNREDLEKLIKLFKENLIPAYLNKNIGFSEIVKPTFWLIEDERRFYGEKSSSSWRNLANSIKDEKHIIHDVLRFRLRPTKDIGQREKFIRKLKKYITYLERSLKS